MEQIKERDGMTLPDSKAIRDAYRESTMRIQTLGEEIANSITHGIGAVLSAAGLALLVVLAVLFGDTWRVVSLSIYGSTLILLYLISTLYHGLTNIKAKRVFRILDHSSIFLLIAGTYTPVTLIYMRGPWGWTLFGLIWGLAAFGISFKLLFFGKYEKLSVLLYIIMGWLIVIAIKPMLVMLPDGMLLWIVLGGLSYTLGIIFYGLKRMPYHHTVWHLFVLGGSICHFFGMLFYTTASY